MKKKIFAVCLVICLLSVAISGTLAYLTDEHAQKNTFTVGNVDITLDEAEVVKNTTTGNLDDAGTRTSNDQEYHLFPAMTVVKDPTITVTGSEDAWVAAKIVITGDLTGLKDDNGNLLLNNGALNYGALLSGWTTGATIRQEDDTNVCTIYVFMTAKQAKDAKITLFKTLSIPANWDNDEMAQFKAVEIDVTAYAVQTNGFADCESAMKAGFPTVFNP